MDIALAYKEHEKIEQRVQEIRKKVAERQGQVVLSVRDLVVGNAKGCFGSSPHYYHAETGSICGNLEEGISEPIAFLSREGIKLPVIVDSEHLLSDNYLYFHEIKIPVQRKLFHTGFGEFGGNFRFSPEDLKKSEKGTIDFGRVELEGGLSAILGYKREVPYLSSLDVLVGDGEVKKFMEGKFISGDMDDFFKLMAPGELEKRVAEYDSVQRADLVRRLVQDVAKLCLTNQEILEISGGVLKARAYRETDEEGRYHYVEWEEFSREIVGKYMGLKNQIGIMLGRVIQELKQAQEQDLTQAKINGKQVGFPSEVDYEGWECFVKAEVLPQTEKLVGELDAYLESEEKRVGGRIKRRG